MRINAESVISLTSVESRKPAPNSSGNNVSNTFASVLQEATPRPPGISESTRLEQRTRSREHWLKVARTNPEEGKTLAYGYAHNYLAHAMLDVSDRPNTRYSGTGELVTPKTEAYFAKIGQEMQRQCANMYREEVNKGTSPDRILEKIFEFHDSMPKAFRDMIAI